MIPPDAKVREVLDTGKEMINSGLVAGTWGNISVRLSADTMLITPSGLPYTNLKAGDLVVVNLEGEAIEGRLKPSSETKLHTAIYRKRSEINGIVHTHSPYAAVFAVTHRDLPPVMEEMAQLLGGAVKVAPYHPPGSVELADAVVDALADRSAVFLANHGAVGVGCSLEEALLVCRIVEKGAMIYLLSQLTGKPYLLDDGHVQELRRNFLEYYGQKG
jgi:L-fuculose-phosphate aldolase